MRSKYAAWALLPAAILPWILLASPAPTGAHDNSSFMHWSWPNTTAGMRLGYLTGELATVTGRADLHASDSVWNASSVTPNFNFVQGLSDSAVYWTGNSCTTGYGGNLWIVSSALSGGLRGVQYECMNGSQVVRATIRMDSSDVTWNTGTGGPSTGESDLRSIATHEIGHALGFTGHFLDDAACVQEIATMCQYYPGGIFWRSLGYHDIHTVEPSYD